MLQLDSVRDNRHMDIRVVRTRRALQEALLSLARAQPFHTITIGQITDRAEVNRSSFYQHYSDKETLLADALDEVSDAVGPLSPDLSHASPRDPSAELLLYFKHIEEHSDLYRLALNEGGSALAGLRIRRRFEQSIDKSFDFYDLSRYDGLPRDVACAAIAGSILAVIERWLARKPHPSVEEGARWVELALQFEIPSEAHRA